MPAGAAPQTSASSSSSLTKSRTKAIPTPPALDAGSISDGVYRNSTLGFACKIPAGWVLRTREMNGRADENADKTAADSGKDGQVLLAAFSRPPEARAEDVNSSILIAAETAATYPGLKDAAQYFGPLSEVALGQGFKAVEDPYEFVIGANTVGAKTVVRGDFQKDVGTRVMHQSTLVLLAHGYAISLTFIGGTDDEVEELVEGLTFGPAGKAAK
jgi:hypothetical protein